MVNCDFESYCIIFYMFQSVENFVTKILNLDHVFSNTHMGFYIKKLMANHNDIKTLTAKIPMANPNQVNQANLASKQKNSDGHQFFAEEGKKCSYAKFGVIAV
ncbi:unnamed protein product [Rhizophagus irregularis]|nr:unnamed protein product [Rhizophagus irregularis]